MQSVGRLAVLGSLFALGCGGVPSGHGTVVGFVVDGKTGQRINFFKDRGGLKNVDDDASAATQIYTVVGGVLKRAVPCGSGDATEKNGIDASGCYRIDNLPRGMTIPIFVQAPGYERFHGSVSVPTGAQYGTEDTTQTVANIRLFPVGFSIDYQILTHLFGRGVSGATVNCQIRQSSGIAMGTNGSFLSPQDTTSAALTAQTDANGVAAFPGASLVNGATYHCEAFRNDASEGRALTGDEDFIAGVTAPQVSIALSQSNSPDDQLYATYSNVDDSQGLLGPLAKMIINFNRPVEIVAGTVDCQIATISTADVNDNQATASLKANVPNNNESETASASLSSDGRTLTLDFKLENPLDPGDLGTSITFGGIYLRPAGGTVDGSAIRRLGAAGGCTVGAALTTSPLQNLRTNGNQSNVLRLF